MSTKQSAEVAENDEDARLMLAVQAGDPLAFEELMARNQTRVCSFLLRFVGSPQLAEDLAQEVFLRVFKHRATYRQEAKFTTWLYRVAHNVAFNALRAKGRHPEVLFSGVSSSNVGSTTSVGFENSITEKTGSTPTRQLAKVELQQIVRAAVDALPSRQREAILLSRFEGLSYQEIADVMNMSPQAVKSLVCRAKMKLKEALEPYLEEGRNSV